MFMLFVMFSIFVIRCVCIVFFALFVWWLGWVGWWLGGLVWLPCSFVVDSISRALFVVVYVYGPWGAAQLIPAHNLREFVNCRHPPGARERGVGAAHILHRIDFIIVVLLRATFY